MAPSTRFVCQLTWCVAAITIAQATAATDATAGGITGVVTFKGAAPERTKLLRDTDPICAATDRLSEDVVVTDGKLRDVLVRIVNGPTFTGKLPEQVVLNQNQCMYEPRVVGVVVGQKLAVQNGDPTFHNVRGNLGDKTLWNTAHPKGAPAIVRDNLAKAGEVVHLHCDVHPWMAAYAYVLESPWFAVSKDTGAFSIPDVPDGSYTLEAIHPTLGKRTAKVKVVKGKMKPAKLSFVFSAKT